MFIIDVHYKVSLEKVEEHVQAHRDYLDQFYQNGTFLVSGPKDPKTGGLIVCLSDDREFVDAAIHNDPFYKEGVADFTVTRFLPVKKHPRLAEMML